MPISSGCRTLSLDDILDYKTELEILSFYLDIDSLPIMICSPLRVDKGPSFKIDYDDNGRIRYYDFGGNNDKGSVFDLLMNMYQLDFWGVLSKIYDEMIAGKPLIKIERQSKSSIKSYAPTISKLEVKVRPTRAHDVEFWARGGITPDWMTFGDIYPISHMFITKDDKEMVIPCDRYAYAYVEFKDGLPTYKIYQPFSEHYKWLNKHDRSVWDLWTKLPSSGDVLIITKSRKDALTIWANTGIPATCLQAESMIFKESVVNDIKSRFKNVFILYDNDYDKAENYGRLFGERVARQLGFKQIEIPDHFKCTDSFEFRGMYGEQVFRELIFKLINYEKKL